MPKSLKYILILSLFPIIFNYLLEMSLFLFFVLKSLVAAVVLRPPGEPYLLKNAAFHPASGPKSLSLELMSLMKMLMNWKDIVSLLVLVSR